jgi:hypothetical protein
VVTPKGTTTVAGEPSTAMAMEVVVLSVPVEVGSPEFAITDTV